MSTRLNGAQPYALGLFRFVIGLIFAIHGASSLFGLFGGREPEVGAWPGWYAALIQLVCGTLVALGLGTRIAAFLASGSMAYAYFVVHQPEALTPVGNGGEASALFCWAFLLLVFTGPGAGAVDRLLGACSERGSAEEPHRERATAVPA
ncbi:DoxX family protein [Streptomyces bacillaris]|uniref:DoxX family protein n=1 Tax=Streptomyces bacillaris TaxID=68179 RepID=UPI003EBCE083